ncbi:glutathione S-transferase family protein [Ferrovibrio sp.]|uniref:glutathione S-transferase family protein n=1 Tax=Ferrovibrio sp. TaxID=1917215 RepID=UPI002635AD77|nr:glutathione S-transferase [Ferrovibrio sp.]
MPIAPTRPIRLHRFPLSGHAHRAELFLSLLGLPFEKIEVDLRNGAQKQPDFLRLNPFGQVPVIEDDGHVVADSNAILVYLATKYDQSGRWLPRDPALAADVQRWLSVAAGPLAMGPALARLVVLFGAPYDQERAKAGAAALFAVMEQHLASRPFFVGTTPTIADIALYSYIAHAPEGGVSLQPYPQIRAWLQRIEALPGFVPMVKSPTPQAAE